MPVSIKQLLFNQVIHGEVTPGGLLGISLTAETGLAGKALRLQRTVESEAGLRGAEGRW